MTCSRPADFEPGCLAQRSKAGFPQFLFILAIAGWLPLAGCSRQPESAAGSKAVAEAPPRQGQTTALDRYVAAPDTNYSFHLVKIVPGTGQTTFLLEMTSQAWLTTNEVDRPLWKHWLILVRPETVTS